MSDNNTLNLDVIEQITQRIDQARKAGAKKLAKQLEQIAITIVRTSTSTEATPQ